MKTIYLLLLTALLAVGMAACSKDDNGGGVSGDGFGKVNMAFSLESEPGVRAIPPSTAMPTTSWNGNIKDMLILFVEDGSVKDARDILPVPTSGDIAAKHFAFTNIKASATGKAYDVYVIANSRQSDIRAEKAGGGSWNVNSCVGSPITDLLMKLAVNTAFTPQGTAEAGSTGYLEPAEIFVAKRTGVRILADQTNDLTAAPFRLTRFISMLRVRIDQSKSGNDVVDFTHADASFRIRRATVSVNPLGTLARGGIKDVLYTKGAFYNAEPASGYSGGTILNPAQKITLWKDIRMFPGGSAATGSEKFDIVLTGKAPAGYVPMGHATGLTAAADVAWTAAVNTAVNPNYILEINLTLERKGIWLDDPANPGIPEVGQYGNADVNIELVPWAGIVSEDIPV